MRVNQLKSIVILSVIKWNEESRKNIRLTNLRDPSQKIMISCSENDNKKIDCHSELVEESIYSKLVPCLRNYYQQLLIDPS